MLKYLAFLVSTFSSGALAIVADFNGLLSLFDKGFTFKDNQSVLSMPFKEHFWKRCTRSTKVIRQPSLEH